MQLIRFTPEHAAAVAGWAESAREAAFWCGRAEFPITAEHVAAWQQDPDTSAYLLLAAAEGGEPGHSGRRVQPVGYGELWTEPDDPDAELAHIIIAPGFRSRGYGRVLVTRLADEATHNGAEAAVLRVHPDNAPALRCYEAVGFHTVPPETAAEWNTGQPTAYTWLRRG